jgi:hypothetical protein
LSTALAPGGATDFTHLTIDIVDPQKRFVQSDLTLATSELVADTPCAPGERYEWDCPFHVAAVDVSAAGVGIASLIDDTDGAPDRWIPTFTGLLGATATATAQTERRAFTALASFAVAQAAEPAMAELFGLPAGGLAAAGFIIVLLRRPDGSAAGGVSASVTHDYYDIVYVEEAPTRPATGNATSPASGIILLKPKSPTGGPIVDELHLTDPAASWITTPIASVPQHVVVAAFGINPP